MKSPEHVFLFIPEIRLIGKTQEPLSRKNTFRSTCYTTNRVDITASILVGAFRLTDEQKLDI